LILPSFYIKLLPPIKATFKLLNLSTCIESEKYAACLILGIEESPKFMFTSPKETRKIWWICLRCKILSKCNWKCLWNFLKENANISVLASFVKTNSVLAPNWQTPKYHQNPMRRSHGFHKNDFIMSIVRCFGK